MSIEYIKKIVKNFVIERYYQNPLKSGTQTNIFYRR